MITINIVIKAVAIARHYKVKREGALVGNGRIAHVGASQIWWQRECDDVIFCFRMHERDTFSSENRCIE